MDEPATGGAADHRLIELCDELCRLFAAIRAADRHGAGTDEQVDALGERWSGLATAIIATRAGTREGVLAKARALRCSLGRDMQDGAGDGFTDDADEEDRLAWSLVNDMLGEGLDWRA